MIYGIICATTARPNQLNGGSAPGSLSSSRDSKWGACRTGKQSLSVFAISENPVSQRLMTMSRARIVTEEDVVVEVFRICKNDYHVSASYSNTGESVQTDGINRKLRSS